VNYTKTITAILSLNPQARLADGLEAALIGHACVHGKTLALYSSRRVIEILMKRDGMDEDEASEFFEFNIAGSYIGPDTPIFHHFQWEDQDTPEDE